MAPRNGQAGRDSWAFPERHGLAARVELRAPGELPVRADLLERALPAAAHAPGCSARLLVLVQEDLRAAVQEGLHAHAGQMRQTSISETQKDAKQSVHALASTLNEMFRCTKRLGMCL